MDPPPPQPASDARAADWIAPRLIADFGAVTRTIPSGFSAYARILHPADPGSGSSVRWSEVARRTGRTMHAQAQFDRIAIASSSAGSDADAHVDAPMRGDLVPDQLAALCAILRRHTPASRLCWYAIWEGWGQLDLRAATFDLPHRRYYLFTGPLDDVTRFGHWVTRDWFLPRSPNLFWPDDRYWCVASEIDFDSTLVAGSADLIDDILRSPDLEAWPVGPRDSLAHDGDTINQP